MECGRVQSSPAQFAQARNPDSAYGDFQDCRTAAAGFNSSLIMPAKLSTHVLDIAHGCPASGMKVELWSLEGEDRTLVTAAKTNSDGRTDAPLLSADEMKAGQY